MNQAKNKLQELIAKRKAEEAANPTKNEGLVFWGTHADKEYLPHLKGCTGSYTTYLRLEEVKTKGQVQIYCKNKSITKVVSTSLSLLKLLLEWDKRAAPSLSNYAGSHFTIPTLEGDDKIEIVFINPLRQLVTVAYGKFMARRQISKLTEEDKWFKPTEFYWMMLEPKNEENQYKRFANADLIAVDIETFKENAVIRCLSYTCFWFNKGHVCATDPIYSETVVLPLDSEWALAVMRKWNSLPAPKVMQGGKYDAAYFARYSAPLDNYIYDTANMFHCMYSELPKDLGFLNAFFIREAMYWKDLSETDDLYEYYKYNALDTWGTGNAFLAMMLEAEPYAIDNYLLEFPLTFPCHYCEMRGLERDMEALDRELKSEQAVEQAAVDSLNTILAIPEGETFNPNSPQQVKSVLKLLGCQDLKDTSEKTLERAKFRHPLNARILNLVLERRKAKKLISTYLTPGKEFHRLDGTGNRILYALNPYGTDSGRLASKEHHFWCGLQIQNIPRPNPKSPKKYSAVKATIKADPGFKLYEIDLEQAESRDTGYISGDANLIDSVENSPDFHCQNASMFFGIPFEELYDVTTGKKLNKEVRDIAKNVNHGANYVMGDYMLVLTMTEERVYKAKKLLGLPKLWTLKQVAQHLLDKFHESFPALRAVFYVGVVDEIMSTGKLTSKAHHYCDNVEDYNPTRVWTRHCFGKPKEGNAAYRSYISHVPQNLNARTLNEAFMNVYNNIQMNPAYWDNFKLAAQIHDSILCQIRNGHEYIADMIVDKMEIPVTIKAYDGVIRTFIVPAEASEGGIYWSDIK